jgi:hypothetical protein
VKEYLRSLFVDNKQTTFFGLMTLAAETASFTHQWLQSYNAVLLERGAASVLLTMPDPTSVAGGLVASFALIFFACDPKRPATLQQQRDGVP